MIGADEWHRVTLSEDPDGPPATPLKSASSGVWRGLFWRATPAPRKRPRDVLLTGPTTSPIPPPEDAVCQPQDLCGVLEAAALPANFFSPTQSGLVFESYM